MSVARSELRHAVRGWGMSMALAAALTLAGCGASTGGGSRNDLRVLASVRGEGGRCAEGTCTDELAVFETGRWRRTDTQGRVVTGRLDDAQLTGLRQTATDADVDRLLSAPAPSTCATDVDGLEMTYVVGSRSVSSCDHELPVTEPLIAQLNALFDQLR